MAELWKDPLRSTLEKTATECAKLMNLNDQLAAQYERLRKFAVHIGDCPARRLEVDDHRCTCGLMQALAEPRAASLEALKASIRRETLEEAAQSLSTLKCLDPPNHPARRFVVAGEIISLVTRNAIAAWLRDLASQRGVPA